MRFSQRIYIIMLVLFTMIFNIGIFFIMHYSYKEEYENTKQHAAREAYFLISSLNNDFNDLNKLNELTYDKIETIFKEYQEYYGKQGIFLEFYEGDTRLYGTVWKIPGERKELILDSNVQNILSRKVDGAPYLFVSGKLQGNLSRFTLVRTSSLKSLKNAREDIIMMIIKLDVLFSLIFSVILAVILKKLFTPLSLLSKATDTILKGDYTERITIHGKNEFSELATKFNHMSATIEEKIEKIRQEAEMKQKLVDNMAHELRTPLTSISGYAEYIKMAEVTEEEKQEILDFIVADSKRLSRLSNTLLDIAEFRENAIEFSQINIRELQDYLRKIFNQQILIKSVNLSFTGNAKFMTGNKEMVKLLFANLIENAIRACHEGGHVVVSFENGTQLITRVTDDGVGMAQEELQKIAEPFYRVDKARSRMVGGVGLGVTLCSQIALCHGAGIRYYSELGKGTTVEIIWNG